MQLAIPFFSSTQKRRPIKWGILFGGFFSEFGHCWIQSRLTRRPSTFREPNSLSLPLVSRADLNGLHPFLFLGRFSFSWSRWVRGGGPSPSSPQDFKGISEGVSWFYFTLSGHSELFSGELHFWRDREKRNFFPIQSQIYIQMYAIF